MKTNETKQLAALIDHALAVLSQIKRINEALAKTPFKLPERKTYGTRTIYEDGTPVGVPSGRPVVSGCHERPV